MARLTVEDCIDKVTNRFELVLYSAHRARAMSAGAELLVERDNDKNTVVALREIAEGKTVPKDVREDLVGTLQQVVERDEPEEGVNERRPRRTRTAPAPTDAMPSMDEDEILAALQQMEASAPKDRGDV